MAHVSRSNLEISWEKPDIESERWEFFNHPAKQDFYERNHIGWDQLVKDSAMGMMAPYPRSSHLEGVPVTLSYAAYGDYEKYLAKAKRGYRINYAKMENVLQREGVLILPAPIVIVSREEALLFSGYRRLCLAWNYGMAPYVWLIRSTSEL